MTKSDRKTRYLQRFHAFRMPAGQQRYRPDTSHYLTQDNLPESVPLLITPTACIDYSEQLVGGKFPIPSVCCDSLQSP